MEEKPSYYAIVPANVRYDESLTANEKLLYGEITALASKTGDCWASNSYFAELYKVTTKSVSNWISHLKDNGYIDVSYEYQDKVIVKRIIKLSCAQGGMEKNFQGYGKNLPGGMENIFQGGMEKKVKDNNTSNINNTSNNITNTIFKGYHF